MWITYFNLNVEYIVNKLVSYESTVRPFRLIKSGYKQPRYKDATNIYIPTNNPAIIYQEEDNTDVSVTDIPAQEPPTNY